MPGTAKLIIIAPTFFIGEACMKRLLKSRNEVLIFTEDNLAKLKGAKHLNILLVNLDSPMKIMHLVHHNFVAEIRFP